jgi:hypothetical protein
MKRVLMIAPRAWQRLSAHFLMRKDGTKWADAGSLGWTLHSRGIADVPIESLFRPGKQGKIRRMAFAEGQLVRVKNGQASGVVARKLAYLQDMYVIHLDGNQTPAKKLAHESDLELLLQANERRSA